MKMYKKTIVLLLMVALFLSFMKSPIFAANSSQDGIEVTLSSDKEEYKSGDDITVTLSVTNKNNVEVKKLLLENIIPEGYKLAEGAEAKKQVEILGPDESTVLKTVYLLNKNIDTEADKPAKDTLTGGDPKTGDDMNLAFWIVTLVVSVILIIIIIKIKKGNKFLSLFLSLLILGGLVSPVFEGVRAAENDKKSIKINKTVKLDKEELKLSAIVTYEGLDDSSVTGDIPKGGCKEITNSTNLKASWENFVKSKKEVSAYFIPADFDGDCIREAYGVTGKFDGQIGFDKAKIYFIDSAGNISLVRDKTRHNYALYGYFLPQVEKDPSLNLSRGAFSKSIKNTDNFLIKAGNSKFIVWEIDAGGSGSLSLILGVRDGKSYQPDISESCKGFGAGNPGEFIGYTNDFSQGYHDYIANIYYFDQNSGQFTPSKSHSSKKEPKEANKTVEVKRESLEKPEKSPKNVKRSVDLKAKWKAFVKSKGKSSIYFIPADYDGDGTKEAFGITGSNTSYNLYENPNYDKAKIYFIDSFGNISLVRGKKRDGFSLYGYIDPQIKEKPIPGQFGAALSRKVKNSDNFLVLVGKQKFIVWEDVQNSIGLSFILGVKNGKAYEPKISEKYSRFEKKKSGKFVGYTYEFSNVSNSVEEIEHNFRFNNKTSEFVRTK